MLHGPALANAAEGVTVAVGTSESRVPPSGKPKLDRAFGRPNSAVELGVVVVTDQRIHRCFGPTCPNGPVGGNLGGKFNLSGIVRPAM